MATPENRLTLETDFIDPAEEDWSQADDAELYHSAKAGIPQAVAELERREAAGRPRTNPAAERVMRARVRDRLRRR